MLWQGTQNISLDVSQCALAALSHQAKTQAPLCRNCGCRRFLVESAGKTVVDSRGADTPVHVPGICPAAAIFAWSRVTENPHFVAEIERSGNSDEVLDQNFRIMLPYVDTAPPASSGIHALDAETP